MVVAVVAVVELETEVEIDELVVSTTDVLVLR